MQSPFKKSRAPHSTERDGPDVIYNKNTPGRAPSHERERPEDVVEVQEVEADFTDDDHVDVAAAPNHQASVRGFSVEHERQPRSSISYANAGFVNGYGGQPVGNGSVNYDAVG